MNWDQVFYGNTLQAWATSLGMVLLTMIAIRVALRVVVSRIRKLAAHTRTDLDDLAVELLDKTRNVFILLIAVWLGARPLELSPDVDATVRSILVIGMIFQAGFWGNGIIRYLVKRYRAERTDDPGFSMAVGAIGVIASIVLWSVLLLTALDSLGVDVTALVASLGIGGLAVALALQTVLGDLLGSLSIIFDKPFVIGDFVTVGDMSGTVENVGLKTTRIRSLSGEQLVFSNSDLLSSRIRNYGRMQERRVVFSLGVTYGTPSELLKEIPTIVKDVVESVDNTRFDRSHFKSYGASSLDFETVYFMRVPDYAAYMDTQQIINLGIYERFEEKGLEFAFPTQTLHVESLPQDAGDPERKRGDEKSSDDGSDASREGAAPSASSTGDEEDPASAE